MKAPTARQIGLATRIAQEAKEAVEDIEKAMRHLGWPAKLQSMVLLATANLAIRRASELDPPPTPAPKASRHE